MSHVQNLYSERFLLKYSTELPWKADTTKSLKPYVLLSTQARNSSEVLSFAQCSLKLPVVNELPIHPRFAQMEELKNATEFADIPTHLKLLKMLKNRSEDAPVKTVKLVKLYN